MDHSKKLKNLVLPNANEKQVSELKERATRKRGRGFTVDSIESRLSYRRYGRAISEATDDEADNNCPQRSVEGWLLFVTNVHEETEEEDVLLKFNKWGPVKNLHLNLDRRTGYIKGYCLVEYETYAEAHTAKTNTNKSLLLGQEITVDWAFAKGPRRVSSTWRKKYRKERQ